MSDNEVEVEEDYEEENIIIPEIEHKERGKDKKPRKKRVMSEEVKQKMLDNLRKGREKRHALKKEEKDARNEAVKKLKDKRAGKVVEEPKEEIKDDPKPAVATATTKGGVKPNKTKVAPAEPKEEESSDDEPVIVKKASKKKKKPKKIIIQTESDSSSDEEAIVIKTRGRRKTKQQPIQENIPKPTLERANPVQIETPFQRKQREKIDLIAENVDFMTNNTWM